MIKWTLHKGGGSYDGEPGAYNVAVIPASNNSSGRELWRVEAGERQLEIGRAKTRAEAKRLAERHAARTPSSPGWRPPCTAGKAPGAPRRVRNP